MPSALSKRTFLGRWLARSQSQPAPSISGRSSPSLDAEEHYPRFERDTNHIAASRSHLRVECAMDSEGRRAAGEGGDCATPLQPITFRKSTRGSSLRRKRNKLDEFFSRRSWSHSASAISESRIPRHSRWSTCSTPEGIWRRVSESSQSDVDSPCTCRKLGGTASSCGHVSPTECVRSIWKDEYLYAMVLQAVVNPLGAPDANPGLRPKDLALHLQQVFGVDDASHEKWIKEVEHSRPTHIALNVDVIEARNLRPMDVNGLSDPYCVLCLGTSKNKTPKGTPKGSPRGSPSLGKIRKASMEPREMKRTQKVKATLNPTWNESFELEVQDIYNEEVEVYVWDSSDLSSLPPDGVKHSERPTGIRGLIRHLKQSVDFGKQVDDFIGQFRIPLKDIPAQGLDAWFDLYEDKKLKVKAPGQCRLKLELSIMQLPQMDCVESDQCSVEDFYRITKQLYKHAINELTQRRKQRIEKHKKSRSVAPDDGKISSNVSDEKQNKPPDDSLDGRASQEDDCGSLDDKHSTSSVSPLSVLENLPVRSRTILGQFAVQQHFSKTTQLIIELVVLLEMAVQEDYCVTGQRLVKNTILALDNEWVNANRGYTGVDLFFEKAHILTDMELSLFEKAATEYVDATVERLTDIPTLFPPCDIQLEELNNKISILVSLLNLYIWAHNDNAKKDLSVLLVQKLQSDVRTWVNSRLEKVRSDVKEKVLPETKLLVSVLHEALTVITPIYSITEYFSHVGIDYFKVASLTIESKLAVKANELMQQMDKYQIRYQKYRVNIHESSSVSLQLYFSLRNLFSMVKGNITERDLFRLTVSNYQSWFETAVVFWLQTFREEGIRRMEKALEIDKDVVQVTSLVKYSNSSVDVLSCFSKMTTEWRQIDFCDADIGLLGVTKITDTICDGARQYAEKIQTILENNCYYDLDDNNQFDVTDQLCITLNNIEHVRCYLHELPQLLNFTPVTQNMSIKHESERVGRLANETLLRLVASADLDVSMRGEQLQQIITDKMAVDLRKYTERFTCANTEKQSNVDQLLVYLGSNLQVLYERLESTIFPQILSQIWIVTVQCFHDSLLSGRSVSYYEQMTSHLSSLRAYFQRGCEGCDVLDNPLYDVTVQWLQLNSYPTRDLVLQYLSNLTNTTTPMEYLGMLAVRLGSFQTTKEHTTLYVTVESGEGFPGLNRNGLSDPYVTVTLLPSSPFPESHYRTDMFANTISPNFNETFQFSGIPSAAMSLQGAVVVFTVWNHETLLPDEVMGEIIISLCDIPVIPAHKTIEEMQTVKHPLKRYPEPCHGAYQVLKERSDWDKAARNFVLQRRIMAGYECSMPLCSPIKKVLKKLLGRRPPPVNVYGSAPIL